MFFENDFRICLKNLKKKEPVRRPRVSSWRYHLQSSEHQDPRPITVTATAAQGAAFRLLFMTHLPPPHWGSPPDPFGSRWWPDWDPGPWAVPMEGVPRTLAGCFPARPSPKLWKKTDCVHPPGEGPADRVPGVPPGPTQKGGRCAVCGPGWWSNFYFIIMIILCKHCKISIISVFGGWYFKIYGGHKNLIAKFVDGCSLTTQSRNALASQSIRSISMYIWKWFKDSYSILLIISLSIVSSTIFGPFLQNDGNARVDFLTVFSSCMRIRLLFSVVDYFASVINTIARRKAEVHLWCFVRSCSWFSFSFALFHTIWIYNH